jgi:hypothetical protein
MRRTGHRSFPSPLSFVIVPLLAAGLACSGGSPDPSAEEGSPANAAEHPAPAVTTPAPVDSVITWVGEIREGIEPLAQQVGTDPTAARQRAVELYATRQERIEQAVGPGTDSAEALAESVHEAEAGFHELMQVLGESPPPDSTRVAAAVEALDARLAEVLDLVEPVTAGEAR